MKVFLASDHGGFCVKEYAKQVLDDLGISYVDLGTNNASQSVDYPDFALILSEYLKTDLNAFGIVACGTGIGISMAANRHKHIRCALCHDQTSARLARAHNNANVLAFGGRMLGNAVIQDIIKTFFSTEFEGGRHERRILKFS
ncbi:MAG: allose-6-phosphate isomerase / ribose-5-phosphate isomerase B [Candidatus Campylobacter infans]|nr:MAG: allose-6-phosphate isomerase / ribose-5-phosphate isomerase B [Candidatus Campylobacter infans]